MNAWYQNLETHYNNMVNYQTILLYLDVVALEARENMWYFKLNVVFKLN